MSGRNRAVLVITSASRSAVALSNHVGLTPDRSWEKGTARTGGTHGVHRLSGVAYESRVAPSLSPEAHVADLAHRLGSHFPAIRLLRIEGAHPASSDDELIVRCWIYHETEEHMTGFDLAAACLLPFVEIGCIIGINVDFEGD
jgi:hypothetical protein